MEYNVLIDWIMYMIVQTLYQYNVSSKFGIVIAIYSLIDIVY